MTYKRQNPSTTTPADTIKKKKRSPFACVICLNDFTRNISHNTEKCDHSVCRTCIRKYFRSTLNDSRYTTYELVQCPGNDCSQNFNTNDSIRRFFSKNETDNWWNSAIKKTFIKNKVSCPMRFCRAVFDVDEELLKKCTFTECYECHRGFCIACQKSWHPGEIRIVNDEVEAEKTLQKAKQNHWCRCPKCHRFVEKVSGCSTMKCLCGTYFCYRCGGGSNFHACLNRCQEFNQEKLNEIRNSMFVLTKKPRV